MLARIYRPAKTAMQSGTGRSRDWLLEFEASEKREVEPLMGWTSSGDTRTQLRLSFETKEEAVAYAEAHAIPYQVFEPRERKPNLRAYADNFRYDRKGLWTH
ncbi:MAG: ETC complex I subunit [Alphaproteobacteria bacterium]|nr:ETC complex I subunit [Alphaproteobacteria bacterium]